MRVRELINKKNNENEKKLLAIRSDAEILADGKITSLLNFIVPETDIGEMSHAIPVLDELLRVEAVENDPHPPKQKSEKLAQRSRTPLQQSSEKPKTEISSSDSSLNLPDKIDFKPGAKIPKTSNNDQAEDLITDQPGPSKQNSENLEHACSETKSDTVQPTSKNSEVKSNKSEKVAIEKDVEQTGVVVKRIWAKKLATTEDSYFRGGTKSLHDLKDPFKWVNNYVMEIKDKKKTFRTLLSDDTLFCNPGLADQRLSKYYNYINQHRKTTQTEVVGFQTFFRNLIRDIAKPETFCFLSRNFGKLPIDKNMKRQVGIFIDELLMASEPNLDGKVISISGRKIEELVREHLYRILDDDSGFDRIEVNFKRANLIGYDFILKQLLKFNQFSWSNISGISLNPDGDFDENMRAEFNEGQLLLRNLISVDLVTPGKLSSVFAANFATEWAFDENGQIQVTETWSPSKLTRLSKPTSVDNILVLLKDELRLVKYKIAFKILVYQNSAVFISFFI